MRKKVATMKIRTIVLLVLLVVGGVTAIGAATSPAASTRRHVYTLHVGDVIWTPNHKVLCTVSHYGHGTVACAPAGKHNKVASATSPLGVSLIRRGKALFTCLADGFCEKHG